MSKFDGKKGRDGIKLAGGISNFSIIVHSYCLHFESSNLALIECSMLIITEPMTPSIQVQVKVALH